MVSAGEENLPVSYSLGDLETPWLNGISPELSCTVDASLSTGFSLLIHSQTPPSIQGSMRGGLRMLWEHCARIT